MRTLLKNAQRAIILIFIFISSKAYTQINYKIGENMYADAQTLLLSLQGEGYHSVSSFAEHYSLGFIEENKATDNVFSYNLYSFESPFLEGYKYIYEQKAMSSYPFGYPSTLNKSKISSFDVTNVASGMAKFLAQRAQSEITESFFWSMQKRFEKIPELQFFFPKTFQKLNEIKQLNLSLDIDILKVNFEADISNFQDRVYHLTQEESVQNKRHLIQLHNYITKDTIGQWIGLSIETIGNSKNIEKPIEFISNFSKSNIAANIEKINNENYNLLSTARLLDFAHQSLQSPSLDGEILTKEEFDILIHNEDLLKVYLALFLSKSKKSGVDIYFLLQKNVPDYFSQNVPISEKISLEDMIEDFYLKSFRSITYMRNFMSQLYNNVQTLNTEIIEEQLEPNKSYYREIYNIAFSSVNKTVNHLNHYVDNADIATSLNIFSQHSSSVLEVADGFKSKNYKHGILSLIQILNAAAPNNNYDENFFNNINSKLAKDMLKAYFEKGNNYKELSKYQNIINQSFNKENFASQIDSLEMDDIDNLMAALRENPRFRRFIKSYNSYFNDFIKNLNTYGNLLAAVSMAESSDDIKAAIEATVLGTGSSRMKRNSKYSITVNAYVGVFAGRAFYKQLNSVGLQEKNGINTFGITAPIGISFNKGLLHSNKNPSTLSLTLQIIDIGSLINFYFKGGDGVQLPSDTKIQLGDILAPGTQLSYSIGDTPFTIMAGVQYVPSLSRIEQFDSNFKPLTWRAQLGFAIDIPLFNIKIWQ